MTIPGTTNLEHLEENIARSNWRPSADLLAQVDSIINHRTVAGSRYPVAQQQTIDTEEFPSN